MKKVLSSVLAGLFLIGSAVWAKDYKMVATTIDPGAIGTVNIDVNDGNKEVKVTVEHLAKPTLLTPPANEYIVWIQPQGQAAQNSGALTIGDNEKADVKMTTTASQFVVLVTAETEAHPKAPSDRVVLRTDVQE